MAADFYLGTQGWSYPDWVGPFYPPGAKQGDFLRLYSQVMPTVEVDSTFYGTPRASMGDGWDRATPPGFRFAAKLPQAITHERRLEDVEGELFAFLEVVSRLGEKLGPMLAQLPPDFRYGEAERVALKGFVGLLPPDHEFAIEFRHRSWIRPEIFELLRERGVAWCIHDLYYMPTTLEVTAGFVYLRWLGDRRRIERFGDLQIDRSEATDRWAETLRELSSRVTRIYGYYNNHYAGHSPGSVRQLQQRLGMPESIPPARGLFDE